MLTRYIMVEGKLYIQEVNEIEKQNDEWVIEPVNRFPWIQSSNNQWARKAPERLLNGCALHRVPEKMILKTGERIPIPEIKNGYIPIDTEFFLEGSAEATFETAKSLYEYYIRKRNIKIAAWSNEQQKAGLTALESWC